MKYEVLPIFQKFYNLEPTQLGKSIKAIHFDSEGDYISTDFFAFL